MRPIGTATPDTEISLEDFQEKAEEEGCVVITNDKGTFIGEPGTTTGQTRRSRLRS